MIKLIIRSMPMYLEIITYTDESNQHPFSLGSIEMYFLVEIFYSYSFEYPLEVLAVSMFSL